jgi:hypothetical protein
MSRYTYHEIDALLIAAGVIETNDDGTIDPEFITSAQLAQRYTQAGITHDATGIEFADIDAAANDALRIHDDDATDDETRSMANYMLEIIVALANEHSLTLTNPAFRN